MEVVGEDQEEMEREAQELRDLAGVSFHNVSMIGNTWPPRAVNFDGSDEMRLKLDRLEGRRSGKAGGRDVPPLPEWPLYSIAISDIPKLDGELDAYKVKDFTQTLETAFKLGFRWVRSNIGRSLYFTETGAAKLSSTVETCPIMIRQIQGLSVLAEWLSQRPDAMEVDYDDFIKEKEAAEVTADELKAVLGLPKRGEEAGKRLLDYYKAIRITAILSPDDGTAMAVWRVDEDSAVAEIDFLMGYDCMSGGPEAEEVLLKHLGSEAGRLGATELRCRVKFTEDGLFFRSGPLRTLDMVPVDPEAWEGKFKEEVLEAEVGTKEAALMAEGKSVLLEETPESVPGLRTWLTVLNLQAHLPAANEWCEEMGATGMDEVVENREDLADALGDAISAGEREVLLAREY